jgi:phosphohistidine phosphatase SixA
MTSVDLIEPPMPEHALLVGSRTFGEIILVRHGQQGDNGFDDPVPSKGGDAPLSELGLSQAEAVAAELGGERFAPVYCSHLERAATTAQRIAARHSLEPIVDEALQEVGIYRDVPVRRTCATRSGLKGWRR